MAHRDFKLTRRSVLASSAAALTGATLSGRSAATAAESTTELSTGEGIIAPMEFYYPNALLDEDENPLTDESMIAVEAEPSAEFVDAKARYYAARYVKDYEKDGTKTEYPDDVPIPLVAIDDDNVEGTVVGVGSLLTPDGTQWSSGNAEFLLNLWDETTRKQDSEKTVLFHEFNSAISIDARNDQYWSLDRFSQFRDYAESNGYSVITDSEYDADRSIQANDGEASVRGLDSTSAFAATLLARNPEVVWLSCPNKLREPDLQALDNYVGRGGTVVLHDCSDFIVEEWDRSNGYANGRVDDPLWFADYDEVSDLDATGYNENDGKEEEPDPSGHLNEVAEHLGVGFRFNDGIVHDTVHNVGPGFGFEQIPVTAQFNTDRFPDLFADRDGIPENDIFYHYKGTTSRVKDGDTYFFKAKGTISGAQVDYADFNFENFNAGERGYKLEVRSLGIDATEDGISLFERPVEWEGLADGGWRGFEGGFNSNIPVIQRLQFENACSLVHPDGGPLTDRGRMAVRGDQGIRNENPNDDASGFVEYGEKPIPLVVDGDQAVGIGSLLVNDDAEKPRRKGAQVPTIEFLQNVWDAYLGGDETVLYDESHGQPVSLADHSRYWEVTSPEKPVTDEGPIGETIADYEIDATRNLIADLDADTVGALWLTPPKDPFTDDELSTLQSFVDEGGVVFIHGRSAATGDAYTDHLNDVANAIGAPFRFNEDQVIKPESDDPTTFTTKRFYDDYFEQDRTPSLEHRNQFPYFLYRQNADSGHNETPAFSQPELEVWSDDATRVGRDQLEGEELVFEFDPDAPMFEGLGRLLGNTYRAEDYPDGPTFEEKLLKKGLARVYDSSYSNHDELLKLELEARRANRGLWGDSDPAGSPPIRNRPVSELYMPQAASITSEANPLDSGRAPVLAEPTADQNGDPTVSYGNDVPLVGIDEARNIAMLGSPLIDESYEMRENDFRSIRFVTDVDPFWVNTAGYENFVFLANLIQELTDKDDGTVFIDGGHLQFGGRADRFGGNYTLSAEDCRYFERFLEGVNINAEGINDLAENLTGDSLLNARAIIISTPRRPFTADEITELKEFRANGGAIILLGSAEAPADEQQLLNELAADLGTDLRLNTDKVVDEQQNLKGLPRIPTTTTLNRNAGSESLFTATEIEEWTGPGGGDSKEDDGGDGGDGQKPEMSASGTRSDDGDVFTKGQTNQVDISIETVADPVTEVRIADSVPDGWTVQEYGDAEKSGDVDSVDLGTVTSEELANADGGITRTYFVEATGSTGRDTFGPATATVLESNQELQSDSAEFGGTDTNTVVGVDQRSSPGSTTPPADPDST